MVKGLSIISLSRTQLTQGKHVLETSHQISFQTQAGSVVAIENVNIASCTGGRCSHMYEPPSNPPSSYDRVSVVAGNVVGVGATQTISELTLSSMDCNIA